MYVFFVTYTKKTNTYIGYAPYGAWVCIMIFKGLTAYSFRIDLSNNEQSTAEIVKFFEKYNVVKYYGNPEIGKETQKEHYQMIIWMQEQNSTCITKMRNYWRGKVVSKKGGGVSLKKARDEKKLFGYCRKDEKNSIFTNVSKDVYEKIKKYETLTAVREQKRQKLQKIIGGISSTLDKNEYLGALEKAYFSVYGKPCFRKNFYLENLRIAGYMKSIDVINYIFRDNYIPGDESLIFENVDPHLIETQANYKIYYN